MNDDLKKELFALRYERTEDLQNETIHITKGTEEIIYNTSKKLNISYEEAIELLIGYGSNPLLAKNNMANNL